MSRQTRCRAVHSGRDFQTRPADTTPTQWSLGLPAPEECRLALTGRHEVDRVSVVRTALRIRIAAIDIALFLGLCAHCRAHMGGLIGGTPHTGRARWMSWTELVAAMPDDLIYAHQPAESSTNPTTMRMESPTLMSTTITDVSTQADQTKIRQRIEDMANTRDAVTGQLHLAMLQAHRIGVSHQHIAESAFTGEPDVRKIVAQLNRDEDLPAYNDAVTWIETRR